MAMAANGGIAASTGPERRLAPRRNIVDSNLVTVDLAFQSGALLLDVSEGGIGVQTLARARVGATTSFHFQLTETGAGIDGVGTVAWSNSSGRVGIRFDQIAQLSQPHLVRWLSRQKLPQVAAGPSQGIPHWPLPQAPEEMTALRRDLNAQKLKGDEALAFVLERARSLTRATGAALALGDADSFLCRASSGAAPAVGARLDPASGLSGECVRTSEVVRCDDTETDPLVDRMVCRQLELRSAVIVPLKAQTRIIGVLEVFSSEAYAFESSDVLLLRDIAEFLTALARPEPTKPATTSTPAPAPANEARSAPASDAPPKTAESPGEAVAPVSLENAAELPSAAAAAAAPGSVATAIAAVTENSRSASDFLQWAILRLPDRSPRLKRLLAALAVTMLAASAWMGWNRGRLQSSAQASAAPVPITAAATVPSAPLPADTATAAVPATPPLNSAVTSAAKPAAAVKKSVPALVLAPSQPAVHPPEPPPAITVPDSQHSDASGLSSVLAATAVTPSLQTEPAISQGVVAGKLIRKIDPLYPMAARRLRVSGEVVVKATLDVQGQVGKVTVLSGHPVLAGAAAAAVKRWRWEPFRLNGVPVPGDVTVRVNFSARD